MVFVGGALAGFAVGLAVAAVMRRPAGRPEHSFASAIARLALAVSAVALAVSGVALANSGRRSGHESSTAPAASSRETTTTRTPAPAASTTTTTRPSGLVTVPGVETLARADAVNILERAGFKVGIETLPLSNVPAGYVISQTPLPNAMAAAGTTVTLVVSAPA